MSNVYYWFGAIMFWTIAVLATLLGIVLLVGFLYHRVWIQYRERFWIYQVYEYFRLKQIIRKQYQTNFITTNWKFAKSWLGDFVNRTGERKGSQLFRKKTISLLEELMIHEPKDDDDISKIYPEEEQNCYLRAEC